MPDTCLFCKIINRVVESNLLYENEDFVVFRDINPAAPVHLLLVPRRHIRSINDLSREDEPLLGRLFSLAGEMARVHGVSESGYKLLFNVEKGGGQMIFHLHLHLIGGWS